MNGKKSTGHIIKMFGEVLMNNIKNIDQHRSWDHTFAIFSDVTSAWDLQQNSTVTF